MVYLQHKPPPPLAPWVKLLWYVRSPAAPSHRERVLPTGDVQIVLNLAREHCTGCGPEETTFRQSPALLVGVRPRFGLIDTRDLEEMVGVVFSPAGLRRFLREPADLFGSGEIDLDLLWGHAVEDLRSQIAEVPAVTAKINILETFLHRRLNPSEPHAAVRIALDQIGSRPSSVAVDTMARSTGLSSRRLRELFRNEVGVGPKTFSRIRRFQVAVQALHRGHDLRWADLALDCGYFDQAHFSNDFREFSGINPTTYVGSTRPWSNHVIL